jgi:phosphoribosylamine--glycine ligase
MRILILGSGGREHALFLKISQSPMVDQLFIAPGNGGCPTESKINIDINDFEAVYSAVVDYKIHMVVVGPEIPLAGGIKDYFAEKIPELMVFGPAQRSAMLEASKVFSYQFMVKAGIPTAKSSVAENLQEAEIILKNHPMPVVIKADGLAAGKGVSIHHDKSDAIARCKEIFEDKIFGDSGNQILFQQFLTGSEASLFAICNGKEAIYLPTACDYKRAYDNGQGPNTGGMGSFSPGNILSPEHIARAHREIVQKVIDEFQYTGVLYTGLMISGDDLSVIEFNCRLGDPETQSVLPMMESDLVPYLIWSCGGEEIPFQIKLNGFFSVPAKPGYTINVVLAANGYPGDYSKNIPLKFPENIPENIHIVHAGTAIDNDQLVSTGWRIVNIVSYDKDPETARKKVYGFIDSLKLLNDFSKLHYRMDIGNL